MIEGIVTGYEEAFDFPERHTAPQMPYMLASVPRSGSTWFSHVLWGTGCLGAPLEYCNFEPSGPYGFAAERPDLQNALWQRALARRTSPNGVFGLKTFPGQLHHIQQFNAPLVDNVVRFLLGPHSPRKVVQLYRRDRDAHAISYARALLTGIWRAEQEGAGRPEADYSPQAVERAGQMIVQQEDAWRAMCRDLRIAPLHLCFEDALADPAGAVEEVGRYLGVAIDPAAAIDVPQIRQQSRKGAAEWAQQHKARRP
ncbi:Stf0 family sulfotransferase [Altererythrobacter lauratis]|uniref:Stf0 family sulfotransferase n=1 Tax=Alteraurantiacibacter lauratis TaxID=2054627 RepID=A0ABV7EA19_9SPHN